MTATEPSIASLVDLSGRVAVVTGGAVGIGYGIAARLAEAGAAVTIADADGESAAIAAKELRDRGFEANSVAGDIADAGDVAAMFARAEEYDQRIDILVNNAGIYPFVPALEETPATFERVLAVNLEGTFLCSQHAARLMIAKGGGGRIINITSVDALHPSSIGLAHYDASKHGVWGLTKNLALELAPHRIWVNAIAPGGIATPGATAAQSDAEARLVQEQFAARVPMGRMGAPDDIGRAALFLASDLASYITGSQLVVDGGLLLT